jgi:hypothetical protein
MKRLLALLLLVMSVVGLAVVAHAEHGTIDPLKMTMTATGRR